MAQLAALLPVNESANNDVSGAVPPVGGVSQLNELHGAVLQVRAKKCGTPAYAYFIGIPSIAFIGMCMIYWNVPSVSTKKLQTVIRP
jgi:hypothetical protein